MIPQPPDEEAVRRLLAYLGAAMVATGQPVSDAEHELAEVATRLGYPDAQIAGGPTGLHLTLASGAPSTYESVNGPLRLDQAVDVRAIRAQLAHGVLSVEEGIVALLALRSKPPLYPTWLANLGWVGASVGIALILQPGWPNLAFTVLGAAVVVALFRIGQRVSLIATLLPVLAAFLLACAAFAATNAGLLEGPLRTLLAPLAVLLPGALIVTAMSELAAGAMVAGSSRLIFGGVQLLLFTLGIVAASRLVPVSVDALSNIRVDHLGWWASPLGLLLITLGIAVLEGPPLRLLPWIALVLMCAFFAQSAGQQLSGAALGSFLGAVAASLGAYLVEAINPRLPRLVVFLPAFWLLVPGSLGLVTSTQLAVDPTSGPATVVGVLTVMFAIATGLLVGTAIAQSVRGALRRWSRRQARG